MSPRIRQFLLLIAVLLFGMVIFIIIMRFPTTTIPVAAEPIPANTLVTQEMVAMVEISTTATSALSQDLLVDQTAIVGRYAQNDIGASRPFFASDLTNELTSGAGNLVLGAEDADKLMIFVTTNISLNNSSGNIIQPGDYVNLIRVNRERRTSELFLEKVHVVGARNADGNEVVPLAPGEAATSPAQRIAGYLLALSPQDATYVAGLPEGELVLVYTTADAPPIPDLPIVQSIN